MRFKFTILFLFFSLLIGVRAQQPSPEGIAQRFQKSIETAQKSDRLVFLDSLCDAIENQKSLGYEKEVIKTIALAKELDSATLFLKHTSNFIFYLTNRSNRALEGLDLFLRLKSKDTVNQSPLLLASLYANGGDSYFFSGKIEQSIVEYNRSKRYALQAKDSLFYAKVLNYEASAHSELGAYAKASKLFRQAIAIATKLENTRVIVSSKVGLANLYSKIGFIDEAEIERIETMEIINADKSNKKQQNVPVLYNMALDYRKQNKQHQRISVLNQAYAICLEENNEALLPLMTYSLLSAYAENDSIEKANYFYDIIVDRYSKATPIPIKNEYHNAMSHYFYANKQYDLALKQSQDVLERYRQSKNVEGIYITQEALSNIYEKKNNSEKALSYYKEFISTRDSITSVQKTNALSYYQTLYETQKKDFTIVSQKSEIDLLAEKNKKKQQGLIFGGLGFAMLFLITWLIRSRKQKKDQIKLQEQFSQDLLAMQEKERIRIARDLHDSVGQKLMLLSKKTKLAEKSELSTLATNSLEELRSISRGLYPAVLERLGLTTAITVLIDEVDLNTDIFFSQEIENIDHFISKEDALHFYRIIQESINNLIKHSQAKGASIEIYKDEQYIRTSIKDNGIGFDPSNNKKAKYSLGMKTLYERTKMIHSKLNIVSIPRQGTTVELLTPIAL